MALNLGTLFFRVDANTKGLKKSNDAVKKFTKTAENNLNKTNVAARRLGIAIGALVSAEAVRRVVLFADEFNVLTQRIQTATRSTGDFAKVNAELFDISQRTRTSLQSNVEQFQAFSRNAGELGADTDGILQFVEALRPVDRYRRDIGTRGGQTALRQLAQGLGAGIIRAEEWNSVLEQARLRSPTGLPRGWGKAVGEMRKLVNAGKLLGKDVYRVDN